MADLKNNLCVVGAGELLWDLLPGGKQIGGAPANFAYHAQALGSTGYVISAVGNDALGKELLDLIKKDGLSDAFIAVDDTHPTGTVSVALDLDGVPDFTIHEDVAWDFIPFSEMIKDLAPRTNAVCFGTLAQRSELSRSTLRSFVQSTNPECLRILDVNLRQQFYNKDIIIDSLRLANILKLNHEELPVIAEICSVKGTEINIMTSLMTEFGLQMIALTKGKDGSRLLGWSGHSELKAPVVKVVDTVGAGDAFTAALAMGMLQGLPIETIHRNATCLAAYVCTQKGAMPNLSKELKSELLINQ